MLSMTRVDARTGIVAAIALAAFTPTSASALTFVQVIGLFHVVVGLLLASTLLIFVSGVGLYAARINTWPSHRDQAIRVLEWAVAMLFVLIILIAIVNFFQHHSSIALPLLAFAIIVVVLIFIARAAAEKKKEPKKPGPARGKGGPPKH